jgi:hypothetical protein
MSALIRRAGTETVGCGHTEMSDARALLYNIRLGTPTVVRSSGTYRYCSGGNAKRTRSALVT